MASEDSVNQLVHFLAKIFAEKAIVNMDVKRQFCRALIEQGKLFEATDSKFDLTLLAGMVGSSDVAEDAQRATYHLNVAVSNETLNMLSYFHPTLRLVNGTDTSHPHPTAQVHRAIDVRTMVRDILVGGSKCYLDIGGNYIAHPKIDMTKGVDIHCCTLKRGWLENHRQSQRDTAVLQGAEETDKCQDGVESCNYYSEVGMCVHVLPEIDPDSWVSIFKSHGLRKVESVHHYPTDIDSYERSGFMQYPNMHWRIGDDDVVEFHFDDDASFAYYHKLSWLKQYAQSWIKTSADWDFVIFYEVRMMQHGMLYSSLTRLSKTQVTMSPLHTQLLYTGGHADIMVPVARFNSEKGCAVDNPMGYDTVYIPVPESIYNWAFFKGISNDTCNPDKPFTRNAMRDAIRVINRNRVLNGFVFSELFAMDAATVEAVSDGIYTAIVMQDAYNKMTIAKVTEQMQRMQRKWGSENMLRLMTRTVTLTALLPYFLLADELQDAVDVMRMAVAKGMCPQEYLIPPQHRQPYKIIGRMAIDSGPFESEPEHFSKKTLDDEFDASSRQFRENYYRTYKDQLSDEQKKIFEDFLYPDGVKPADDISVPPPVSVEDDADIDMGLPSREETLAYVAENREVWLEAFNRMRTDAPPECFLDLGEREPKVGNDQDVHRDDKKALLEYALHCFDLHQTFRANALEMLTRHWAGTSPNITNMRFDNDKDIGATFYNVVDECIMDVPEGITYDQVMDPYDRSFKDVQIKRDGSMFVGQTRGNIVYALNSMRISNSKRIGAMAMKEYEKGFDLSDVEFHLVDGIAGSGKTRTLTAIMDVQDVFATGPAKSAESVRKWCKSSERFKGKDALVDKQFRTVDSHNLSKTPRQARHLYIDEGFMLHDGAIVLLAIRSGAKKVYVSGDNAQIGVIDRGAGYGQLMYTKRFHYHSIKYLNETERSPADATVLMRELYPEWRRPLIKTMNPIRRSFSVEVYPNHEHAAYRKSIPTSTVLTFTQNDKAITSKAQGFADVKRANRDFGIEDAVRPVMTVHESQGETFHATVIHRLTKYSNDTFKSSPHQYVAFSRHKVRMILRTVCDQTMCEFTKLIMRGVNLSEAELDSVMIDTPEHVAQSVQDAKSKVELYFNVNL